MKNSSKIAIAALITGLYITPVLAGGGHGHHGHQEQAKPMGHGAHGGHGSSHGKGHGSSHGGGYHNESATGNPALGQQATKTIKVTTLDTMRYKFSGEMEFSANDIVKFVVTNEGKIGHEFSIGDTAEQTKHRKMMQSMPGMVHQDGNTVTVKPGETKELVWKFNKSDDVVFACNIPGHFEAGMLHKLRVR